MPEDLHAECLAWVLRKKGHVVDIWVGSDFPHQQIIHFEFSADQAYQKLVDQFGQFAMADYDRVWFRRTARLHPSQTLHPSDQKMAVEQATELREAMFHQIAPDAFWVNPIVSTRQVENKPRQLVIARQAGFQLPRTMVSNDPAAIRRLYRECDERMIYKPLRPMSWTGDGRDYDVYTSALEWEDLKDNEALQLCPGIYQQNLEKVFEVRVNMMGRSVLAVAIDSQSDAQTRQDWRLQSEIGVPLPLRPIEVPETILRSCRSVMKSFGTVFGAFDFIVTPNGQWVFLEVNGMGQFLWVEEKRRGANIPMAQVFSEFLESGDENFCWSGKVDGDLSLDAYLNSDAYKEYSSDPLRHHVERPRPSKERVA